MNSRLSKQHYDPRGGGKEARCAICVQFDEQWVRSTHSGHPQRWCEKAGAVVDNNGICPGFIAVKKR
jgi:hypothetical protein